MLWRGQKPLLAEMALDRSRPLSKELRAWWACTGSITTLWDIAGGNHAPRQGGGSESLQTSPGGIAVAPDGFASYWQAPHRNALSFGSSFTLAALITIEAFSGNGRAILAKGGSGETSAANHNYLLGYDNGLFNDDQSGDGWVMLFEESGGTNWSIKYLISPSAGTRSLVMGVFDATAQELRLYLDGLLVRTRSSVTGTPNTQAVDVTIADDGVGTTFYNRWGGQLEFVAAWGRALTSGEAMMLARDPYQIFLTPDESVKPGLPVSAETSGKPQLTVADVPAVVRFNFASHSVPGEVI